MERIGLVDWNPATNEVTPVDDAMSPLHPLPQIEKKIVAAMYHADRRQGERS